MTTKNTYTVKFFQDWIDGLRQSLQSKLPLQVSTSSEGSYLTQQIGGVTQSKVALKGAEDALAKLERQTHPPASETAIAQAKHAVQQAQMALDHAVDAAQDAANAILIPTANDSSLCDFDQAGDAMQLSLPEFLSYQYDDQDLITLVILMQGTPQGFAAWCQSSSSHVNINDRGTYDPATELMQFLTHDNELQRSMMQGGGAKKGCYGRAVQLYHQMTQAASTIASTRPEHDEIADCAKLGCCDNPHNHSNSDRYTLKRLALAVALELSAPLGRFDNPKRNFVAPIQRYVHYEQAFLLGELDPIFSQLTVWEMRHVINSDARDEELGWCRISLTNYRPDHVYSADPQWRYCRIVRSDIGYTEPDWYKSPHSYDQILSGGGKCGPRAWYGRFSCQAFGIPIWGCRQPGHAAMTRWTRQGWMTCLGAGWQYCTWEDDNRNGLDFQLETQARNAINNDTRYMQLIQRLAWLGLYCHESEYVERTQALPSADNSFWYSLELMQRRRWRQTLPVNDPTQHTQFPPPCHCRAPSNQVQHLIDAKPTQECPYSNSDNGMVTIPISAFSCHRDGNTQANKFQLLKSAAGGQQLQLMPEGSLEFTISPSLLLLLPSTGGDSNGDRHTPSYRLDLQVCTVHRKTTPLLITLSTIENNGNESKQVIPKHDDWLMDMVIQVPLPYTVGDWAYTEPVQIDLSGKHRTKIELAWPEGLCSIAIKQMRLVPVDWR